MAENAKTQGIDKWYVSVQGKTRGPATFDRLLKLAAAGQLKPETLVKLGLDGKWRSAGSIGRIVAVLPFEAETKSVSANRTAPVTDVLSNTPARGMAVADQASSPVISTTTQAPAAKSNPSLATAQAVSASSTPVVSDAELLDQVRTALDARGIANFSRIELEVSGGVILARGNLGSEGERLLAVHILQKAAGTARVIDSFTVSQGAAKVERAIPVRSVAARGVASVTRPGNASFNFSQLIESVKGEYRNQAIAAVATIGILGFWFVPRGPVRPVAVHPVQGKVILDGQPLANAAIVLHRVGDSKLPANLHPRGKASEDGTFKLETFDPADGAPDGDFVATVFLTHETEVDGEKQAGPNLLPAVYSKPETSPLRLKITSSTRELHPLELTKG